MFKYFEYSYISTKHVNECEIEARNLEDLESKLIPILGLEEDSKLCTIWNKTKGGWNSVWLVRNSFGEMRVREGFIQKY